MLSQSFLSFAILCSVLALVQALAALPWLLAIEPKLRFRLYKIPFLLSALGACVAAGVVLGMVLDTYSDREVLSAVGRVYGSILQMQFVADCFVVIFFVGLLAWPKGSAVALAAFREGLRHPMFWLLTLVFLGLCLVSPFIPYFTFGEDLKMVKELCYAFTMLAAAWFAVVGGAMWVHEEIEGRTAITVMSKPVSRREFLLGKFFGILLVSIVMVAIISWTMPWLFLYKFAEESRLLNPDQIPPDPAWVLSWSRTLAPVEGEPLLRGLGLWIADFGDILPGLIISSCQVMVLLAISVALATRVPMVVNLTVCLLFYFLGHLTPIMTDVARNPLVLFVANVFDTVFPGLDLFDVGTAIVREVPLPAGQYAWYTLNVTLYAVVYTTIALLFGLILFEDRDLA